MRDGMDLPEYLKSGEAARLFPVLADTSKEGRTLSILLSCLCYVDEFGKALLSSVGQRVGSRASLRAFTEVVFKGEKESRQFRPDGLILLTVGSRTWSAVVEAKVGISELKSEQIENYLELARNNNIDAVITVSNQFAAQDSHYPVPVNPAAMRKTSLYHWPWMYVLTQANLLISNDEIIDRDQRIILNEFVRFLTHDSAGVRGFDQMPAAWTDLVSYVQAGSLPVANSSPTREVISAWHQEVRDLSLILSRKTAAHVKPRLSRAHAADHVARMKAEAANFADTACLSATFDVPDAAAPLEVCADFRTQSITVSMRLRAPDDRKSTKARTSWLLRQIPDLDSLDYYLRLFWPGRSPATQHQIKRLRDETALAEVERVGQVASSFEVMLVRKLGKRFGQRKNFVTDLEVIIPEFYQDVGQRLKAYQPPAPKIREDKQGQTNIGVSDLQVAAEVEAHEQQATPRDQSVEE